MFFGSRLFGAALAGLLLTFASSASAATVMTSVNGTDNIYFTNWGSTNNGQNLDVTGRGNDVTAVGDIGGAINFAMLGPLLSMTTGAVVDAGQTATDADGQGSLWNGLRVYSMIGVWSSTAGSITNIGDSFFVGTSATLVVPNVAQAYLFLGENDGNFSDNSGAYSVKIDYTPPIPLPAGLPLLLGALGAMALIRRRG